MSTLWMVILYVWINPHQEIQAEPIAVPGPSSGILTQETPGFILTEKRVLSQKVCMSVDPKISVEKKLNRSAIQSPEIQAWYEMHLIRSQNRAKEILEQARKPLVSASLMPQRRQKRFIGALMAGLIFATLGTVVATTVSTVNSVSGKTLEMEIINLQGNIQAIHQVLENQKMNLLDMITVINDTVITVNKHTELIYHSTKLHQSHEQFKRDLLFIKDPILFHTLSFLDEVQNGMNDLTRGHIPLYFVPTDMIRNMLYRVEDQKLDNLQINLAFEMGSALPLYIDPDHMEICFLLAIPYVTSSNVFQMKAIHNVGTWKDGIHVKIQTSDIVAFQPWNPDLYSIPILNDCVKFKDNNFQCNGNPFVFDATQALCESSI
ncbi:uncharacterized protein RCH25_017564 [Pelodytes ibericus]